MIARSWMATVLAVSFIASCDTNLGVAVDGAARDLAPSVTLPLWPTRRHDAQRRSAASVPGPIASPRLKWIAQRDPDGPIDEPVVDANGTLFDQNVDLVALDPVTGMEEYSALLPVHELAVARDGTLYANDASLVAIVPSPSNFKTWTTKWSSQASGRWLSLQSDDTLYVAGASSGTTAIVSVAQADGRVQWSTPFLGFILGMALGTDGSVIAANGSNCVALDPSDGHIKWNVASTRSIIFTPVIGVDGSIYLVEGDSASLFLTALRPADGSVYWSSDLGPLSSSPDPIVLEAVGPPAVAQDGTILMLGPWNSPGSFTVTPTPYRAFTPDGKKRWTIMLRNAWTTPPTVDVVGNSYLVADGGYTMTGISPAGDLLWTLDLTTLGLPGGKQAEGPILIGSGGVLYVSLGRYQLLALEP